MTPERIQQARVAGSLVDPPRSGTPGDGPPERALRGKTCLVTGATGGIGFVLARELAHRGARVVLVGRNAERGRSALEAIRQATGNAELEYLTADLASLAEIRALVDTFRDRHERLELLINNVGALHALRQETAEGIERTLALNYLGVFALTTALLDRLEAGRPARIVNLASSAHADVPGFDFEDPEARSPAKGYGRSELRSLAHALLLPMRHPGFLQYARSKLAVLLFTRELARRLAGRGVTVNAADPGFVRTGFTGGNGSYGAFMGLWAALFGKPPDLGARTPLYLATAVEVEAVSGEYFVANRITRPSRAVEDARSGARLWQLSEAMARAPGGR